MMSAEDLVEETRFETTLTVCAVYLMYAGLELDELEWADGMVTFYFQQSPQLHEAFAEFASGQARVEPQQFNNLFGQMTRRIRRAREEDTHSRRHT